MSAPALRPLIDDLLNAQAPVVTLDVSAITLIDSSGVGVFVSLYKQLRGQGGRLRVRGLRDQPLAIFKLLRLDRTIGVEEADAPAELEPDSPTAHMLVRAQVA